ncbi:MAG: hypothetical protein ACK56F_20465, partial [bacterium]
RALSPSAVAGLLGLWDARVRVAGRGGEWEVGGHVIPLSNAASRPEARSSPITRPNIHALFSSKSLLAIRGTASRALVHRIENGGSLDA